MIAILPYKSSWPDEFFEIGKNLRQFLGDLALRIDHIGSTAVPGLAAKDLIDIQITVRELQPEVELTCLQAGLERGRHLQDHVPPGGDDDPTQWQKWIFKTLPPHRAANVHVRLHGRANQRYALLFRDYLRAFPAAAQAYAEVKSALAAHHPEADMDVYYQIKDPVCDLIMQGAELWAAATGWALGPADC